MAKSGFWCRAVTFVLIVQLACPLSGLSPHASADESPAPFLPGSEAPVTPADGLVARALANPLLETVESWGNLPAGTAPSAQDPAIDADPFFLRAQRWIPSAADVPPPPSDESGSPAIAFETGTGHVSLSLPGSGLAWRLEAPLHPVYSTGDLVLLAANEPAFFERIGGGEGLFFVRAEELQTAARHGERVPVYFFPMPDTGWTGNVRALEFPEIERLVVVDNQGDAIPLDEEDIDTVVSVGKYNLNLAAGAGIRSLSLSTPASTGVAALEAKPWASPLPPRGSTAGFGLLFTGFDWDHPELSLFQPLRQSWWQRARRDLIGFLVPTARADGGANGALLRNLMWAGTVSGVMLAASVVLKYTVFRDFFREKHAAEGPARTWLGAAGREGRDVGDVFAHTVNFARQFPKVWFGKGLRYFIDSWFPRLNSARNNLIKRFLDWSVYYASETSQHVPVNLRTLALQFFVMGGIDTASYAIQLYFTVPWLAQRLADAYPSLKDRVASAFADENPQLNLFRRNEVVLALVGYLTSPGIASDLKDYYSSTLLPEVDEMLRAQGLTPADPRYEKARAELLERKVQEKLAKYALPGNKDFLYDAATLWSFVSDKILGYRPGELKAEMRGENFVGRDRPGLIAPAVRAALGQARSRLAKHPGDPALASAVQLLEQASREVSYLGNFARYPAKVLWEGINGRGPPALSEVVRSVRHMRQLLVALTYDGPVEESLKDIPNPWVQAVGQPGARLASELFRRSFFGYANDRRELLRAPTDDERATVADRQSELERRALDELFLNHAVEFDRLVTGGAEAGAAQAELVARYPGELDYLRDKALTQAARGKIDEETTYQPPRHGWYRRRQEARVKRSTQAAFAAKFGRAFRPEEATDADLKAWNELYGEAMMRQVSIYPDYEAAPQLKERVEGRAAAGLRGQLDNPKAKKFLESLSAEERVDFVATMYAEQVTRAYVDLTVNSELPATSTAQPGRFQWLRQTRFVRHSRFLTRMVRAVESFFPVEAHQAGFKSILFRNVPGLYDFMISNVRTYRNLTTAALATYPFMKLVWGVALPPHLWLLAVATGFVAATPAAIMNRLFQMQGLKPLSSFRNLALYSLGQSWVAFGDLLPDLLLEKDFRRLVEGIEQKVGEGARVLSGLGGGASCAAGFAKLAHR